MAEIREGHIPIPGWAYIIVGVFVSAYAKTMEYNGNSSMVLFFWLGLVLIFWGVSKLAFKAFKQKNKQASKQQAKQYQAQVDKQFHQQQRLRQQQQVHQQHQRHAVINCPACQSRNWASSKFCHQCGKALR